MGWGVVDPRVTEVDPHVEANVAQPQLVVGREVHRSQLLGTKPKSCTENSDLQLPLSTHHPHPGQVHLLPGNATTGELLFLCLYRVLSILDIACRVPHTPLSHSTLTNYTHGIPRAHPDLPPGSLLLAAHPMPPSRQLQQHPAI